MTTIFVNKIKNNQGGNPVQINQLRGIDTAGSITVQGEGSATTNLQQGLNKVWMQYDQDPAALQDSFNVSSLADNGTGRATPTYTNPMSSNSYAVGGVAQGNAIITLANTGPDADNFLCITVSNGGTDTDYDHVGPSIQGDLA